MSADVLYELRQEIKWLRHMQKLHSIVLWLLVVATLLQLLPESM